MAGLLSDPERRGLLFDPIGAVRDGISSFMQHKPVRAADVSAGDVAKFGLDLAPFVGDAIAIDDAKRLKQEGRPLAATLSALSAVPVVGDFAALAKMGAPVAMGAASLGGLMARKADNVSDLARMLPKQRGSVGDASRLFRAANHPSGRYWARSLGAAEMYRNNPGFGGSRIYEARVPDSAKTMRIDDDWSEFYKIAEKYNIEPDTLDRGIYQVLDDKDVRKGLAESGYDLVRFADDYPNNEMVYFSVNPLEGVDVSPNEWAGIRLAIDEFGGPAQDIAKEKLLRDIGATKPNALDYLIKYMDDSELDEILSGMEAGDKTKLLEWVSTEELL